MTSYGSEVNQRLFLSVIFNKLDGQTGLESIAASFCHQKSAVPLFDEIHEYRLLTLTMTIAENSPNRGSISFC